MPLRRKQVRRKKPIRRPRRAKRSRNTRTVAVQRTPGFADATKVKLKYSEFYNLSTNATAVPAYYLYSCNSLYDPNYTGGGHQPFGFDQWMGTSFTTGIYNRYTVFGMAYRITFINTSATYTAQVAVCKKPVATVSTDMNTVFEKPYVQSRFLSTTGQATSRCVLKGYCSNAKVIGITNEQYRVEQDYKGSVTSNPTLRAPYLHIYVCNPDYIVTTIKIQVELVFYATLTDRVPLGGSA